MQLSPKKAGTDGAATVVRESPPAESLRGLNALHVLLSAVHEEIRKLEMFSPEKHFNDAFKAAMKTQKMNESILLESIDQVKKRLGMSIPRNDSLS